MSVGYITLLPDREIKTATFVSHQHYLKISKLQPGIYGVDGGDNIDIWRRNDLIIINREKRQERHNAWEINLTNDHPNNCCQELAAYWLWSKNLVCIPQLSSFTSWFYYPHIQMWNLCWKDSKELFQGEILWCWDQDLNASVEYSTSIPNYNSPPLAQVSKYQQTQLALMTEWNYYTCWRLRRDLAAEAKW